MLGQRFHLFLGQVKSLGGLKLVLLPIVDLPENNFPLQIEILAGRVVKESLSLT